MRRSINRVFGVILAIAGLLLVAPVAQAASSITCNYTVGTNGGLGTNPPAGSTATTYYNLTGQDCNGTDMAGFTQATIQGTAGAGSGATFITGSNAAKVGTGVLQPFVRIQNDGGEKGACGDPCIESGYNTNGQEQFETKDAGASNWTHAIRLSDVGTDGQGNRVFILDINEANNPDDRYLSLDKLQVYLGNSDSLTNFCETPPDNPLGSASCFNNGFGSNANLVYSMDTPGTDTTVGLNYDLNHGSGKGVDLTVKIPETLFTNAKGGLITNPYVYLYSSFGATGFLEKQNTCGKYTTNGNPPNGCPVGILPTGNYGQNAGFEEWSSLKGVPEPMSLALLLVGLAALGFIRRQQASPTPIRH